MSAPLISRIAAFNAPLVNFTLDGEPAQARRGESVLAVLLVRSGHVRLHDVNGEPRAGFCLMGACQDCWVWFGPGSRGRSCMTAVAEGMHISTAPAFPASP